MLTDAEKVAKLLRRFGLGASEAELLFYNKLGVKGTIDRLIDDARAPAKFAPDPREFRNKAGAVNLRVFQGLWYLRVLTTEQPMQEKIAMFWHNHFATSAGKVGNGYVMQTQLDLFRTFGMSSFKALLTEVVKDPAMLYWLDNNLNVKGKPNENFARELFELFTLGIGNYTERDIQETARAFTGWGFGNARNAGNEQAPRRLDRFAFVRAQHDSDMKSVFGKSGPFTGTDIIEQLCAMPRVAEFVTERAWTFFISDTPDPVEVARISKKFMASELSLTLLFREIMESDAFMNSGPLFKTPLDFVASTARCLGAGPIAQERIKAGIETPVINEQTGLNIAILRGMGASFAMLQSSKSQGMELMWPPDVSGWKLGSAWITTGSMVSRMGWADRLFIDPAGLLRGRPADGNFTGQGAGNRTTSVGIPALGILSSAMSASEVVQTLLSIFDVKTSPTNRERLVQAAELALEGRTVNSQNASTVARRVTSIIFALPEYQVH